MSINKIFSKATDYGKKVADDVASSTKKVVSRPGNFEDVARDAGKTTSRAYDAATNGGGYVFIEKNGKKELVSISSEQIARRESGHKRILNKAGVKEDVNGRNDLLKEKGVWNPYNKG